ncbi:MAG TPA: HAMP domain-containing sensor histidine kinase [Saprospiraceae bacterium]|nr:HAMP domain-containing sensor histidine kinase [Saprospiraceae bacterium]
MQIRNRITLQVFSVSAGIMLLALLFIYQQFRIHLERDFYENMKSKSMMVAEMVIGKVDQFARIEIPEAYQDAESDLYRESITIFDIKGNLIFSLNHMVPNVPSHVVTEILQSGESKFMNRQHKAYGKLYTNSHGVSFIVISEAAFSAIHLESLSRILIGIFFISITAIALGSWILAYQALAPVNRIMNQVDSILPNDLSKRLEVSNQKDELSRLVITFNQLLERIHQTFNTQKLFLSNVSHELRNPLNVIISQIEIALVKERTDKEYIQTLQSIHYDAKELNEAFTKLMQLANLSADGRPPLLKPNRIDEVIWGAKDQIQKMNPNFKITMEFYDLPENEEDLFIKCDDFLFRMALINLVDNACKFSNDHKANICLRYNGKESMLINIEDNGPGIPEEEMSLIFNPFFRGANAHHIKGSGIGLALVDIILRLHQYGLHFDHAPSGGTVVSIRIPKSLQKVM